LAFAALAMFVHMPLAPPAKLGEAAHQRNRDEGNDEPIFDRRCPLFVGKQSAQSPTDSDHATLLWSTSTRLI